MGKIINVKIHTQSIVYPITFKPHNLLDKIIPFLGYYSPFQTFSLYQDYSTLKFVYKINGKI